jgi:uncharacterized protein (UPF0276 family)
LYPLSLHGVGLSLGSSEPVDEQHLTSLKTIVDRFEPGLVSDHVSWSATGNAHLGDLLPLPYNEESLAALCQNIDRVQEVLGRQILVENPSTYLQFKNSTITEPEFMNAVVERTGCGLLLDVNNIYVQSHNHGFNAQEYLTAINASAVQEMHLAGHIEHAIEDSTLLIDTHSQPVKEDVWNLYHCALTHAGPTPTLIEWDKDLPELAVIVAEAAKAQAILYERAAHAAA